LPTTTAQKLTNVSGRVVSEINFGEGLSKFAALLCWGLREGLFAFLR
jgi:hypothetical protein